jgi:hypothetical protein
MHSISGRLWLIHIRTTIGGGKASSWVEAVHSGCLSIVSGTMLPGCISKASYPASSSSATASWHVLCMGF